MIETGLYVKKIHVAMQRGRNRALKQYGLTAPQMDTLIYLAFHEAPENTLSGIADFFGVKHTSVIHILKLLEKKQLICREEAAPGTRMKPIFLTEKGKEIIETDKKELERVERLLFEGITQEEERQLNDMLRRIYENVIREFVTEEE
ncbi:MAG: MarR family transcriptional regulator [Lachnospiraceae bacterium]|nr:MarR family transcriptional regulator [Lachnospiraceae bacterium]